MIAEAMVRSVTEIPHAWSTKEVDVTGLVELRRNVRGDFERQEGVPLTYMPFVVQAVVEALRKVPTMNATWGGDSIILKRRINLGLAVAAPNGLIVPVIHNADRLNIAGIAHVVNDLTERARANRLAIEDVQGGTFTLNNTGALGGSLVSGPIINYPQAGIMTTESIEKRAMVRNDAIAIRSMMNVCLSFDHRINDGAEASTFLETVKTRLESLASDSPVY
jgi:2-oxoisovalerate dehydrogenase E2 component (dihydrolipoyl transacylase)